jgi:hypothetical protein
MNLVEAERLERESPRHAALRTAMETWTDQSASALSDHREPCCRIAREWVLAMDRARRPAREPLSGPRWIRERVTWGPSRWPLYWCEAVAAKTLDCGALAALATEAFRGRGVLCHPVQLIQQYTEGSGCHWRKAWAVAELTVQWICDDLVYHEGTAVVLDRDEVRIWDATAAAWLDPRQVSGYGGVLALRIVADSQLADFTWGPHRIPAARWQALGSANTVEETAA